MNWTFNQNCQLIIEELPDKRSFSHIIEVVFFPNDSYTTYVDRNAGEPIVESIKDGLHIYRYLLTNDNPSDIDISKIPCYSNSDGGWTHEEEIFSICHLRKCAIAQEKQAIEEFLSTCHKRNCNKKSSEQSTRDILLISIFVLEYLISENKYLEAERILESLGSCEDLCYNNIKTCNCNG